MRKRHTEQEVVHEIDYKHARRVEIRQAGRRAPLLAVGVEEPFLLFIWEIAIMLGIFLRLLTCSKGRSW